MEFIYFIVSRFYCFFSILGDISMRKFNDLVGDVTVVSADNPFNDFTMSVTVRLNNWLGDIINSIGELANIPDSYTVLDCLLFLTATFFVAVALIRLVSLLSAD